MEEIRMIPLLFLQSHVEKKLLLKRSKHKWLKCAQRSERVSLGLNTSLSLGNLKHRWHSTADKCGCYNHNHSWFL